MGSKQSARSGQQLSPEEIQRLQKATGFTEQKIKTFQTEFLENHSSGNMDFDGFKEFLREVSPEHYYDETKAAKLFKIYDEDQDRNISIYEFIMGTAFVLASNADEDTKWSRIFDLIDTDGNGYADTNELNKMWQRCADDKALLANIPKKDGPLSKEEFIQMIKQTDNNKQ